MLGACSEHIEHARSTRSVLGVRSEYTKSMLGAPGARSKLDGYIGLPAFRALLRAVPQRSEQAQVPMVQK